VVVVVIVFVILNEVKDLVAPGEPSLRSG